MSGKQLLLLACLLLNGVIKVNATDDNCPLQVDGCSACEPYEGGHDVWCPGPKNHALRLHYKHKKLYLQCESDRLTEAQMLEFIKSAVIKNMPSDGMLDMFSADRCPTFQDSMASLIKAFNVNGTRNLEWKGRDEFQQEAALGPGYFAGLGIKAMVLRNLYDYDYEYKQLDPQVFSGLETLEALTLRNNELKVLPSGLLDKLDNLHYLKVIETDITEIPADLLHGAPELQIVQLSMRQLESVPSRLFEKQAVLVELTLSVDVDVPADLLSNNPSLVNVTARGNWLQGVNQGFFASTKLTKLVWTGYRNFSATTDVRLKDFLKDSEYLKSVSFKAFLMHQAGIVFGKNFFQGCKKLETVEFMGIFLKSLPEGLFKETINLNRVFIQNNKDLETLENGVFSGVQSLTHLNLSMNGLSKVEDSSFHACSKLKHLSLSKNQIKVIGPKLFFTNTKLETLDLSGNKITLSGSEYWDTLTMLKNFDLSSNEVALDYFPHDWLNVMLVLERIDLSKNKIGPVLEAWNLGFLANGVVVDLSNNRINAINYATLRHLPPTNSSNTDTPPTFETLPTLILTGNPLICDCKALGMARAVRDPTFELSANFRLEMAEETPCAGPARLENKTFLSVPLSEFSCEFPSDSYGANSSCPGGCRCEFSPAVKLVRVICSQGNLSRLPDALPALEDAQGIQLDVAHNRLTSLFGASRLENYDDVTELIASGNRIDSVSASELPSGLRTLRLDANALEYLSPSVLQRLAGLDGVWLGHNAYLCTCDSSDLYDFVKVNIDRVKDLDNITLTCHEDGGKALHTYDQAEFCASTSDVFVRIGVPILIFVLLLLLAIVVILYYRETILIYLYTHPSMRRFLFISEYSVKDYDVFISYAEEDSHFVEGRLLHELENGEDLQFRCHYHKRDFDPGKPIMWNIVRAVENSSRTLVVLSRSFLQSEYCETEFDAAQHKNRLIVVVYGELPPKKQLSRNIDAYLSANTYLAHDDPWFWQKLRYALPHRGRKQRRVPGSESLQLSETSAPRANGHAPSASNSSSLSLGTRSPGAAVDAPSGASSGMGRANPTYVVSNPDLSASMNGGPTMFMDAISPPGSALRQESVNEQAPVAVQFK